MTYTHTYKAHTGCHTYGSMYIGKPHLFRLIFFCCCWCCFFFFVSLICIFLRAFFYIYCCCFYSLILLFRYVCVHLPDGCRVTRSQFGVFFAAAAYKINSLLTHASLPKKMYATRVCVCLSLVPPYALQKTKFTRTFRLFLFFASFLSSALGECAVLACTPNRSAVFMQTAKKNRQQLK